jgi:TolB-like protein/Tfp pilus assembly protein PilF
MLYRFANCSLDTGRLELCRMGERVEIEPQALAVLTYLIEHRDRVVSRPELFQEIWGQRIVTESALSAGIKAARRAVGDNGTTQSVIRTSQRVGYRFVADVAASAPLAFRSSGQAALDEDALMADLELPIPAQPSVVVLPLRPFGDTHDADIIAQGLTADITTRIGRSRSVFVIARATAFLFGPGPHDVRLIGRKLGVRYVVHGSIQFAGRKMRVTIALANAATREEVWSEQYDETIDDWMRVQQEIANVVVAYLQSEIERAEERRSLLIPSTNLDAWSAYHRGRSFMFRFTADDCAQAEYFFRRSVELEPAAARAYAGLSFVHFQRAFLNMGRDRSGEVQQAHELAMQSLAADPSDPMGHWVLSRARLLCGELVSAKQELETAIVLNPSYAVARYSLGWVATLLGESRLCGEQIERARRLSPYDPLMFAMLGVSALNLALNGNSAQGAAIAAGALLQPNAHYQSFVTVAVCYALDGQRDRARTLYARARAVAPQYDVNEFLRMMPFRTASDIRQIREAFGMMQQRSS